MVNFVPICYESTSTNKESGQRARRDGPWRGKEQEMFQVT